MSEPTDKQKAIEEIQRIQHHAHPEYYDLARSEIMQAIGALRRARQHIDAAGRNLHKNEQTHKAGDELLYLSKNLNSTETLLDVTEMLIPRFIRKDGLPL